jgi:hypothetical protein
MNTRQRSIAVIRFLYVALIGLVCLSGPGALAGSSVKVPGGLGNVPQHTSVGLPTDVSSAVFKANFNKNAATIPEDSGTVMHLTFNVAVAPGGPVVQDTKSLVSWTKNGSPTVDTTSSASYFYPNGFSSNPMPAAQNFSDTNNWSSSSSALKFTSDFWCGARYEVWSRPALDAIPFSVGNNAVGGYYIEVGRSTTSNVVFALRSGGGSDTLQDNPDNDGPNTVFFGRAGTTGFLKSNFRTTISQALTQSPTASSVDALIGAYSTGGVASAVGIHLTEIICSTGTPSAAFFDAQTNAAWGMVANTGHTIALTRATTATTQTPDGKLWTVPAGALRVESNGALFEPSSTNALLQSDNPCNAAWSTVGTISCTANAAVAPDGTSTMALLDSTSGTLNAAKYQTPAVASSTDKTGSAYIKPFGASSVASLDLQTGGTITSCTCKRADGSACTATITGSDCVAYSTFTSTDRFSVSATVSVANTTGQLGLIPGQVTSATGKAYYWRAQSEALGVPTSAIATTGTGATRNTDAASVSVSGLGANWCADASFRFPYLPVAGEKDIIRTASSSFGFYAINGTNQLAITVTNVSGSLSKFNGGAMNANTNYTDLYSCDANGPLDISNLGGGIGNSGTGTGILDLSPATTYQLGVSTVPMYISKSVLCRSATASKCK